MRHLIFCLICAVGCSSTPSPTPIPDDLDAGLDAATACELAGKHLVTACPKLAKTPAGKSFSDFCKETQAAGIRLNPTCISRAKSCDDANACIGSK